MNELLGRLRRHQTAVSVAILALLAYVPALTAAPGRMPADSKLYVYLDPGRFIADTTTTFDPRQFAGWVPHQHIAYLWPTGPWYWTFETIGVPDWVAHRLWIGSVLFAAGIGVVWMSRRLGFAPLAAFVAAVVYQLSPYILPYVSRTSVLLLPYAGLGWIVGCTVVAARRGRWRHAAIVALIVLTVGAVNATALMMVIPAPVLWLVHAAWSGTIPWRRAVGTATKIGVASTAVSLWWIAMLSIQGRYGADVLAYSESLESVSFTSTSTEVGRGLGYWLFYVRDGFAATTTASIDHLVSVPVVVVGFALAAICLAGVVLVRSPVRRYAGLLVVTGVFLGVGVHPIDDPSPLVDFLVPDNQGGLALALRSSTRAVPVLLLGLAIGAASLVSAIGTIRLRVPGATARLVVAGAVTVLAVLNLPALRDGGFVDPALERDQDPPAHWLGAAAALDERPDGYRVLQVPGAEFGSFAWGHTVDQPLPGLTERPLVTRDLLPLGGAASMDLVFALDDRIQEGTLDVEAIAPIARLLGVDTIWVAGDVSFDRYGLARPDVLTDRLTAPSAVAADLVDPTPFGSAAPVTTQIPVVDAESLGDPRAGLPIPPITLIDIADAVPTVRVKDSTTLLLGSGDGLVDAAGAGLIDGTEAIVYGDRMSVESTPVDVLDRLDRIVVTDSNRRRAHHWRSSQDVHGYTEAVGGGVLRLEPADQRLPVFGEHVDPDEQTVSIQRGTVTARASAYGEPFAYRPEHRPVMAIDGDPSTAWLVSDRAPAVGEFIELTVDGAVEYLDLRQPDPAPGARSITGVVVSVDGVADQAVPLGEESLVGAGQRVALESVPARDGQTTIRITITATSAPQPPIAEAIGSVGFAEIGTGHEPTEEWIRPPSLSVVAPLAESVPVDHVFTRLRTEPTDRWRDDPEPVLRREFEVPTAIEGRVSVELRFDQRASGALLADAFREPVTDNRHLVGVPAARGAAAFDDDPSTAWTTPFVSPLGSVVTYSGSGTARMLSIEQPPGSYSPITSIRLTDESGPVDVELGGSDVVGSGVDVALPRPIDLGTVALEITGIEPRVTIDRRYAEPFVLPAAISEVRFDDASPGVEAADSVGFDCRDDVLFLDGVGVPIRWTADRAALLSGTPIDAEVCVDEVALEAGTHRLEGRPATATGFHVDRVVIAGTSAGDERIDRGDGLDPTEPVLAASARRERTVAVPPCPVGCWVIVGEGYNEAWSATVDGVDLGASTLVDGNANGWWLDPATTARTVEVDWTAQRPLDLALLLSGLSVLALLVLAVWDRRRLDDPVPHAVVATFLPPFDRARASGTTRPTALLAPALLSSLAAGLLIDWPWAPVVGAMVLVATALGRPNLVGALGLLLVAGAGAVVSVIVLRERPFPNAGWPVRFEWLHAWSLVGFLLVGLSVLLGRDRRNTAGTRAGNSEP